MLTDISTASEKKHLERDEEEADIIYLGIYYTQQRYTDKHKEVFSLST